MVYNLNSNNTLLSLQLSLKHLLWHQLNEKYLNAFFLHFSVH